MRSPAFWDYFDLVARPKLARRAVGFSKIFTYLDRLDRPVFVVETGCVREKHAWEGDGQSTIHFDKYAEFHPGSLVFSVDLDPAATALCRSLVRPEVQIHTGDSVAFLKSLTDHPPPELRYIDLLYLDSYDVDLHYPLPGAIHSLKELLAIVPLLSSETLVAVDDSPLSVRGIADTIGVIKAIEPPRTGGKGRLIGDYASQIGAELYFAGYQCGWLGFGRPPAISLALPGERRSDVTAAGPRAAVRPRMKMPELALRVTGALSRADRSRLALQLLDAEAEEITFRRNGTRWTAFPWDLLSRELFVEGGFQEAEVRAVVAWLTRHRRFAAPHDVIVDVGANIGTTTIPFAQRTGCRVIAIEPVPEIFAVLCRNVADNGLAPRVTCVQAAISIAGGDRVRMILPEGNSGGGEVIRPDREPSFAGTDSVRGVVDVPAMALGDLLDAHGVAPECVAFVWSDTQGCEAEVIESGRPLWATGVPLFAEFDPTTWGGPSDAEALLAAATARFAGFIPAETLIAEVAVTPQPIARLAGFSRTIGPEGTDVLLLPQTFEF